MYLKKGYSIKFHTVLTYFGRTYKLFFNFARTKLRTKPRGECVGKCLNFFTVPKLIL